MFNNLPKGFTHMESRALKVSIAITLLVAVLIFIFGFTRFSPFAVSETNSEPILRVGYMTTWAEGAFPAEILKNTPLLENNQVNADFVPFQSGPPIVESALAGQLDATFLGWVPTISLISKSDDWVIVGRLAYFQMALMARNGSGVQDVKDLRGKNVGIPFATGPHPIVIMSLESVGLDPERDLKVMNLKPADMGAALNAKQVDAVSWGEPTITLFKQKGLAYSIQNHTDIGFITVSKKYALEHPEELKSFLQAFKESQLYQAQNKKQVYQWFSEESQFDLSLVESLIKVEPNFEANSLDEVNLHIPQEWIDSTQKKIDFEYLEGIIDKPINLSEKIDLSYLE